MRSEFEQDREIDALLERVKGLEEEVARLKTATPVRQSTPVKEFAGYDSSKEIIIPDPQPAKQPASLKPPPFPSPPPAPAPSLENAIGTRWIGRLGVVAILLGVGFFLKYSFDNKLIGEAGRIILGLICGLAFIGAGEYLQKKKNLTLYGQLLSAGGLAILYLSLYAAFAFYHLIPILLATLGMLAVTSAGLTLSVRYSAYALAAVALLGGFLTPVMLSTGHNQPYTLFGYILLLDAGTLLLVRFRPWVSLAAASLCGTILIYASWHLKFYTITQNWLAFGVVLTFFVFYNLFAVFYHLRSKKETSAVEYLIICGSAAFFFLAFLAQYHFKVVWEVKIFTLALALFEITLAMLAAKRSANGERIATTYAMISLVLTVAATFMILEGLWILPVLAAEMAAAGWAGLRLNVRALRYGAYLVGLLVLIRFGHDIILRLQPFESYLPVINVRFAVCAAAIGAFYVLFFSLRHFISRLTAEEHILPGAVFTIAQVLSLALLSFEIYDYFRFQSSGRVLRWTDTHHAYQLSLSVLWTIYASALIGIGIFKRIRGARIMGMLLMGIATMKVFLIDLSELRTFYRIISFIVLGALLLIVAYCYNRFKHVIFGEDEP